MEILNTPIAIAVNSAVVNKVTDFKLLTEKFRNCNLTVYEIAGEIKKGHAIVCAQMIEDENGNIHRDSKHFKLSQLIGVDIDNTRNGLDENGKRTKSVVPENEYFSLEKALSDPFVSKYGLLIYPTVNHTHEWNRFRMLFLLPEVISNNQEYCRIVSAFIKKFGGDEACKDPCRVFYGNLNCEPIVIGQLVTPDALEQLLEDYDTGMKKKDQEGNTRQREEKCPDFPKISIEQISAMLKSIKSKKPFLDYMEWSVMIGSLFDKYTLIELQPILEKYYPEQKVGEYEIKYEKGLDRIPFYHFIKMARRNGYSFPITYGPTDFVVLTDSGTVELNQKRLLDFLHESGYRKYYLPESNKHVFIQIENNSVKEIVASQVKDFIRKYLEEKYAEDEFKEQILNGLYCGRFISNEKLEYLLLPETGFVRDDSKNAHLLLKNGYIHVNQTENGIQSKFKDYSNLQGLVWLEWKKKCTWIDSASPNITYSQKPSLIEHTHRLGSGMFEQFVDHVSGCNCDRVLALRTAIGYLVHSYKTPSLSRAVVFCDETISDHPSGGTGKSLLAQGLSHVRNVAFEDGKRFDPSGRFSFQNVNINTQIVVIDDIVRNFNFESLFHLVTGDFEYERKGENKIKIPYAYSPKILLTTNYTVIGNGNSHKRRIAEYEIYPWYSERFTPVDDFGVEFFTSWDANEWCRFFDFIRICLVEYMNRGLLIPLHKNLSFRKLQQETSSEFVEFMNLRYHAEECWDHEKLETQVPKGELFNEFCQAYPDFAHNRDTGKFSQRRFAQWLKAYASYNGFDLKEAYAKIDGVSTRVCYFEISKNVNS